MNCLQSVCFAGVLGVALLTGCGSSTTVPAKVTEADEQQLKLDEARVAEEERAHMKSGK
ncbi:hypothetical protein NA78x_001360 [Anatilimnocola sp. NA78]|uniref:hypothetical protein n=1 Tax=Anatilimnocola sp. NA78 TaxID=3415683 RepID=UPI003CE4B2DF